MRTVAAILASAVLLHAHAARAQSITTEASVSTGVSTDDVKAGAAQVRAFGELQGGVRFFGEASWARSSDTDNDVFGAAYPYRDRLQVIEAYGQRVFRPSGGIVGIRGGRFRTPFGIYNASDYAYSGFLRPPLIRYDEYASLSNNFLEHGADVVAGLPFLTFEVALGSPADIGEVVRGSGLDTLLRVQGSHGPFVVGISHLRNHAFEAPDDPDFRANATGIDLRWMYSGVQLRGEWIKGQPVDDATNNGWYIDALVHRVAMGPVTAVARIERLAVTDAGEPSHQRRQTFGARVRLLEPLSVTVDAVHRTGAFDADYRATSLDLGFTWTSRVTKIK